MKYSSMLELIGSTPLLELKNIKSKYNLKSNIYAKLESFNAFGSIKDRIVDKIILDLEDKKIINKDTTIIEPTSGNTGIALSAIGSIKGYKVIIIMPSSASKERIKLIKAYGAKVILSDASLGMNGSVDIANKLNKEIENSIILSQFTNENNPLAHYLKTGREIYQDLDGKVDIFVAGIGSGGTISGVGKYLKERNPNIKIIGVEPFSSPLLSENKSGKHEIQGIGANFIPKTLNQKIYDEIRTVENDDAFKYSKKAMLVEGVSIGISSGAALKVAIDLAREYENKNIVVIFPDGGDRYYSTRLFDE